MAHNLAFSIKHRSPKIKVGIWIDPSIRKYLPDPSLFSDIRELKQSDFKNLRGHIDPAKAKSQLYRLAMQMSDKALVLDVDGVLLNDIEPLLESLNGQSIATEITGTGKKTDTVNYSIWASNTNIWKVFNLKEDATLCGVQSSWMYFERSKVADKMQEYLDYYMEVGIPRHIQEHHWGGTIADELLYQGVFAKMGIVPRPVNKPSKGVIFFGHKKAKEDIDNVRSNYYLLSLYGYGLLQPKYLKLADKLLVEMNDRYGFTTDVVMRDKHALNK
jgi:hypothetical protein